MQIDTENYLTIDQVAAAMGTNRRSVYRALARATAEGKETFVTLFGRSLLPRERLAILKSYYFPYYSEAHQAKVKEWGAAGGATKAANRRAAGIPPKASKAPAPAGVKRGRGRPRKNPLPADPTT